MLLQASLPGMSTETLRGFQLNAGCTRCANEGTRGCCCCCCCCCCHPSAQLDRRQTTRRYLGAQLPAEGTGEALEGMRAALKPAGIRCFGGLPTSDTLHRVRLDAIAAGCHTRLIAGRQLMLDASFGNVRTRPHPHPCICKWSHALPLPRTRFHYEVSFAAQTPCVVGSCSLL